MLRNVASQKWRVYAWDVTTGLAKTGEAANITGKINKDDAGATSTNDTNPTEADSANEKGYYDFDLTQAESNAAKVSLSPKCSTSNINVMACPPVVYTVPQYISQLVIDSAGLADANAVKGGPTGAGVAITANTITHLNQIYDTDYATVYDTTNKALLAKLGNCTMGGASLVLTTGAITLNSLTVSGTTTLTGAVALSSTFGVTGTMTLSDGLVISRSTTNGTAITSSGNGTGAGATFTGGATGHGLRAVGGATSGDGINTVATTSGHGLTATGVGTTKHGVNATGGATSSAGISATGGGTGAGLLATGGGTIGDGIKATSASGGNGMSLLGSTGGAGLVATGGVTGNGITASGGGTGHGMSLAGNGSSRHGLLATGGTAGTSDGVKAVAGTGGVPIRGDITGAITGDITGNLSGSVGGNVVGTVASVVGNVGGNVVGSVASVAGDVSGSVASVVGNVGGNVAGSVASVVGNIGGNVVGSVASVAGNVGGNVAGSVASVTAAIVLPSIPADWITAAGIANGAIDTATFAAGTTIPRVTLADTLTIYTGNTVQTGDTYALANGVSGFAAIKTDTGNLVARITSALFAGITSLAQWLGAGFGKQTGNSTARTEIRATGAGAGTFLETTDSLEAIADNAGGGGGGGGTVTGYAAGMSPEILVLDALAADHDIAGTIGQKINAAGGAADPLLNDVPGVYASGTAGAALGRLGTGEITTVSPVSLNGDVEIVRGDSYLIADASALEWTNPDGTWPDLTGATILFEAARGRYTAAGSVVTPTGTQKVRVELTADQSTAFKIGLADSAAFDFFIRATLSNSHVRTLVRGRVTVVNPEDSL